VPGDGADRTDGQTVVAAEHDRQAPVLQLGVHRSVHAAVPGHDFVHVAEAIDRRQIGIAWAAQVAAVPDLDTKVGDGRDNAGNAQGFRPHAGPRRSGADVGGNADDANGKNGHDSLRHFQFDRHIAHVAQHDSGRQLELELLYGEIGRLTRGIPGTRST
jgi:hypothetical protein